MSLFQIESGGQPQGVSAQAYVDPTSGSSTRIAAGALESFGGMAKEVYGGYVLSEMTDLPETPSISTEISRLGAAVEQGKMSQTEAETLFRSRYGSQRARMAALGENKETALKKAPWLSSEIDRIYQSGAKALGEKDMMTEILDGQAQKLVSEGSIYLSPIDTDEDIRWKVFQYNTNAARTAQAEQVASQDVAAGVQAFSNMSVEYQQNLFQKAISIAANPGEDVTTKQARLNQLQSSLETTLKQKYNYAKLSADQRANFDSQLKTVIDSIGYMTDSTFLDDSRNVQALANQNKKVVEYAKQRGLKEPDIAAVMLSKELFGESVTGMLFTSGAVSPASVYNLTKNVVSEITSGKTDATPLVKDAASKVSGNDLRGQQIGLSVIGGLPQASYEKYVSEIGEKEAKRLVWEAQNYISDNLEPTLRNSIKSFRLDDATLQDIKFERDGDKFKFKYIGTGKPPTPLLVKLNSNVTPSLHGAANILLSSGESEESLLQLLNAHLPQEAFPTTGELVGSVARTAGEGIATESTEAGKFIMDVLLSTEGARSSRMAKMLDEKEKEALDTLKNFFNDFNKGLKGG